MIRRGCIFGNSHVATLKRAWETGAPRWSDLDLDFIGLHGKGLADTAIIDGILRPLGETTGTAMERINRRAEVPLADYDFLAIAGAGLGIFPAVGLYRKFRCLTLPSAAQAAETAGRNLGPPTRLLSEPAFLASIAEALSATTSLILARRLAATSKPVFLLEQARPSETALDTSDGSFAGFRQALHSGDAGELDRLHRAALDRAAPPPKSSISRAKPAAMTCSPWKNTQKARCG